MQDFNFIHLFWKCFGLALGLRWHCFNITDQTLQHRSHSNLHSTPKLCVTARLLAVISSKPSVSALEISPLNTYYRQMIILRFEPGSCRHPNKYCD